MSNSQLQSDIQRTMIRTQFAGTDIIKSLETHWLSDRYFREQISP